MPGRFQPKKNSPKFEVFPHLVDFFCRIGDKPELPLSKNMKTENSCGRGEQVNLERHQYFCAKTRCLGETL